MHYRSGMADILEGTSEFNRRHALVTGEIPVTVSDDQRLDMFPTDDQTAEAFMGLKVNP